MDRSTLVEIKKGQVGTGLLIENDGYVSIDNETRNSINESHIDGTDSDYCPDPFIANAVFQRYGAENANGRIYPEDILKREVEKYQRMIKDKRAFGECYTPSAKILTETGWKSITEVKEGENIVTLNTKNNVVEVKPILKVVNYHHKGKMIHIKSPNIDDLVTPDHGYPLYSHKTDKFIKFATAQDIFLDTQKYAHYYIPKTGIWDKMPPKDSILYKLDKSILKELIGRKGFYLQPKRTEITEEDYDGEVYCVEVDNHVWYVMDNGKCHWTKNCNHPSEATIDLSRVAINVVELHWEGNTLVGKIEVITSPGFKKHGIISCQGDQVANLLIKGYKIGLSSRGLGSVTNKMGALYVDDDFELVCFDVVSEPSTHNAWIVPQGSIPSEYMESKKANPNKSTINEKFAKLDKFKSWLN